MCVCVRERERERGGGGRERSSLHPFPLRKTAVLIDLDRSLGSRRRKKSIELSRLIQQIE